MNEKLEKKTEESINKILEEGLTTNNLDHLYKLTKINKIAKEEDSMYGNYEGYGARRPGYDSYGRDEYGRGGYGNYGARGRDMRYRGDDYLDRMHGEYGRYMDNRNRYGAGEETDRSFHYMVKSLEDFIKVLHEEAETPQQKQQLKEVLQRSMM
jgi:hypothetical protein